MPRRPTHPDKIAQWTTLDVLYIFFVIQHARRAIVHVNVTAHPTAAWVIQQLREAFPFDTAPRYLILDRDSKFSEAVHGAITSMGTKAVKTAFRSPWQNGVAERWVGSCRREMLNHVVVQGESHLLRLMKEYVAYYHADRTHLELEKDTPISRAVTPKPSVDARSWLSRGLAVSIIDTSGRTRPERIALTGVMGDGGTLGDGELCPEPADLGQQMFSVKPST